MSHVFLSYSREDIERARSLAAALESAGCLVWWDRTVPPGKSFDEVIEAALSDAHAAVVIWSEVSVKSNWVKAEAEEAFRRGILVPVLIDDVRPPLAFRRIEAAELQHWDGAAADPELAGLVEVLNDMAARGPAPPPPPAPRRPAPVPAPSPLSTPHSHPAPEPAPPPKKKRSIPVLVWIFLAAVAILIAGCGLMVLGFLFSAADSYIY